MNSVIVSSCVLLVAAALLFWFIQIVLHKLVDLLCVCVIFFNSIIYHCERAQIFCAYLEIEMIYWCELLASGAVVVHKNQKETKNKKKILRFFSFFFLRRWEETRWEFASIMRKRTHKHTQKTCRKKNYVNLDDFSRRVAPHFSMQLWKWRLNSRLLFDCLCHSVWLLLWTISGI